MQKYIQFVIKTEAKKGGERKTVSPILPERYRLQGQRSTVLLAVSAWNGDSVRLTQGLGWGRVSCNSIMVFFCYSYRVSIDFLKYMFPHLLYDLRTISRDLNALLLLLKSGHSCLFHSSWHLTLPFWTWNSYIKC